MADVYQLPPDVGHNRVVRNGVVVQEEGSFPSGQKQSGSSIPVILPAKGYRARTIDNYRFVTEIDRDLLGFPRGVNTFDFLSVDDQYDLRKEDWIYDVTGINELPEADGTESARWTQFNNAKVFYRSRPNGEIKYNPAGNSAQLILNSNDGGFQRARIVTKKRYRYQPGRGVRVSMATKMPNADSPINIVRTWGIGDTSDGFFVRVSGDGQGDRLSIIYRNSAGNGLKFERSYPRSEWMGDKLDGTGSSKATLDFSKVFMTMIEWGWYGASNVRVYFFLVDKQENLPSTIKSIPRGRWIFAHEIVIADTTVRNDLTEDDGSGTNTQRSYDVPSLSNPSLPVWVEITNSGNMTRSESIERYGASIEVDGGNDNGGKITCVDGSFGKDINPIIGGLNNAAATSVATITHTNLITNSFSEDLENLVITNPQRLNITASDLCEIELWKDPVLVDPINVGHINGNLSYTDGSFKGPLNIIPQRLASFDSEGNLFELTQEDPRTVPADAGPNARLTAPADTGASPFESLFASVMDLGGLTAVIRRFSLRNGSGTFDLGNLG